MTLTIWAIYIIRYGPYIYTLPITSSYIVIYYLYHSFIDSLWPIESWSDQHFLLRCWSFLVILFPGSFSALIKRIWKKKNLIMGTSHFEFISSNSSQHNWRIQNRKSYIHCLTFIEMTYWTVTFVMQWFTNKEHVLSLDVQSITGC